MKHYRTHSLAGLICCGLLLSSVLVAQGPTPCDQFDWIACGDVLLNQTTQGAGDDYNNVNSYNCITNDLNNELKGPDRLYKIQVDQPMGIRFVLEILDTTDLDLIFGETCLPFIDCEYSIEQNTINGIKREVLDVYVQTPGTYYLVVEGKNIFGYGTYNLYVDCSCTCVEPGGDSPTGEVMYCDDFENYVPNKVLDPQSTRWLKWDSLGVDAIVSPSGFAGQGARLQTVGNSKPRMLYLLQDEGYPPANTGRFRMSWKMNVTPGKTARFNVLHRGPHTGFTNWAYHVTFGTGNTGQIRVANPANAPIATFPYPSGVWINVTQIIDMNKDSAELWINNNYVTKWKFSTGFTSAGTNLSHNNMNAVEFVAEDNTDFRLDNICVWRKTGNCTGGTGPVCVENGVIYATSEAARCDLYTSLEWGACNSLCDFGGTFISRGDEYVGQLDPSDFAADLIRNDSCVINSYGGNVPNPLYADVYIFSKTDTLILDLIFNAQNNQAQARAFVFACNTIGPNGACVSGQQCLQDLGNNGIYTPFTCDSFYYIVVTGTVGTNYSLSIVPTGPCNANFEVLNLDCAFPIETFTVGQLGNVSVFDTSAAANSPYRQCYGGSRPYTGGEKIYKISLVRPSIISVVLKAFAPMGVFLSSYECGKECLNYAEISTTDSTAFLSELLPEGNYFIIIDKATLAGTNDFQLSVFCEPKPFFTLFTDGCFFVPKPSGNKPTKPVAKTTSLSLESCGCIAPDTIGPHTVRLLKGLYDFSEQDVLAFFFRDSTGSLTSNETSYTFFYDTLSPTGNQYPLEKNNPIEPRKCFYNTQDSLYIWLIQTSPGSRNFREMLVTYADTMSPGITATNQFQGGANSEIVNVNVTQPVTFGGSSLRIRTRSSAETRRISFLSSIPWHLELVGADTTWLSANPASGGGGGAYSIEIAITANPSPLPRYAVLRFVAGFRPDFYRYEVLVEQDGLCIPASVVIEADVTEFCEGDSITLTANTGFNPADTSQSLQELYNFKWSDGSSTPIISLIPSVGQKQYFVTITNKDFNCPSTAADTIEFNVKPRPQPPMAVGLTNIRICADSPVPTLTVSVPPGQEVYWYDQPLGGQPLLPDPSPTFSLPILETGNYYAEARIIGGCSSLSRRQFSVIVDSLPSLVISDLECDSTHLTYSFSATTNGNNLIVVPGLKTLTNGVYSIFNVPIGSPVELTAFNAFCVTAALVMPPVCVCTVSVPQSGGNQTICDNQPIPPLSASVVGLNETIDWYSTATGGSILPNGQGVSTFQPSTEGSYFAEGRNLLNGCTSAIRTEVRLTIHPTPPLLLTDTVCTPDLSAYQLSVLTTPTATLSILPINAGTISGGNGIFTISAITAGQNIMLTVTDTVTSCSRNQTVQAPDCVCLTISAPVSGGDAAVCPGASFPALTVTVAPGLSANWFNTNDVLVAADTLSLIPFAPGTYFVQAFNPTDGCTSTNKTPVSLSIYPTPPLSAGVPLCAPNRLMYSVAVTTAPNIALSASMGVLSGSNGSFTVSEIPVGDPLTLTATDNTSGCIRDTMLISPNCPCLQVIAPPDTPGNGIVEICADQPLPTLTVTAGPDQTADWYNTIGDVLALGTFQFQPPGAGTFFVKARDTISNCVSDGQTVISLIIHPLPSVQVVSKNCDSTLLTYTVALTTQQGVDILPSLGSITGSNGLFIVQNVPANTNLTVTALHIQTGCAATLLVTAPVCACDTTIQPPVSDGNVTICVGQPFPPLVVHVGPNQTVVWYNGAGVEIGQGLSYTPTTPGTYFAETKNLVDDCPSQTRTAVELALNQLPTLVLADTVCAENLATYSLEVRTDGTDIQVMPVFLKIPTGPGAYAILNIPVGTAVTITALNANTGCTFSRTVSVNICPCPTLSAPTNLGDQEICQGDPIPLLSVSVAKPSQTADWYNAIGQLIIFGTLDFQPTLMETRTYYAQTRDTETNCISATRTPVTLTVRAPASVSAGQDQTICAGAQAPLSVTLNGVNGGTWIASIPGGVFFPNNNALSAQSYLPPAGASSVTLTLNSTNPPGPCPAVSDAMVLVINPLPSLLLDTAYCAPNLQTYSVEFVSNALSVIPGTGTLTPLGNDRYRVSGIGKGVALSVTVENTDCSTQETFPILDCACPLVIPPVVPTLISICANEPIPVISALVGANETVNWYSAVSGGVLLAPDTTRYQPGFAGTFYAQTQNLLHGCTSERVPIVVEVRQLPQADAGPDLPVCPGDPAVLTAASGGGYTYLWNTGDTTQTITLMPPATATFYLEVTLNSCSAFDSVTVAVNPAVSAAIELRSPVRCFGDANGAIEVNASDGTPGFVYQWSNGSVLATVNSLPAGTYTVTVTDDANCQATATYLLTEPNELLLTDTVITNTSPGQSGGSLLVTIQGGTPPYSYQWFQNDSLLLPGETDSLLDSLPAGFYSVTITDSLGCIVSSGLLPVGSVATGDPVWSPYISIYPNPTKGLLYVRLDLPLASGIELRVLDAMGREVRRDQYGTHREGLLTLDLSGQAAGMYFVQILMDKNSTTQKINLAKY